MVFCVRLENNEEIAVYVNTNYIRFRAPVEWNLVVGHKYPLYIEKQMMMMMTTTTQIPPEDNADQVEVEEEPSVYLLLNRPIKVTGSLDRKSTSGFGTERNDFEKKYIYMKHEFVQKTNT